jgi:hypothetical protein
MRHGGASSSGTEAHKQINRDHLRALKENGVYFALTGNSNTSASMDQSGTMDGTITCTGMYPGKVYYDKIQIKGGAAGGGTYGVEPTGFSRVEVPYNKI